ncbi:hypothetical protein L1987_03070 [Smallanthus sonchifolius]|uniref:Uncharacterized protein n=1 Tax=Smallanthus sonchifolius TaxID=185202 RepID=A0ACB9K9Q3_9ASTR|nr:hypothetical protein L1987_03070 [Smallanthus sonchifolius]
MSFQDIEAGRPLNSRRAGYTGVKQQDPTQEIASGIFQINTAVSTFQVVSCQLFSHFIGNSPGLFIYRVLRL